MAALAPLSFAGPDAGSAGGEAVDARDRLHVPEPSPPLGAAIPEGAFRLRLLEGGAVALPSGERVELSAPEGVARLDRVVEQARAVRLDYAPDSYLAEVAPLLAWLDDRGLQLWWGLGGGAMGHLVELRDELSFQGWIDEARPGKLRVIQRADGFELQSNLGKLPGVDPNGPSVPARGGRDDVATLRRGLERLKERFPEAPDVCFVPSFGMELRRVAEAIGAAYALPPPGEMRFERLCLVYPRPVSHRGVAQTPLDAGGK